MIRDFFFVIMLLILIDFALDNLWILLGENCCWSLLGLKGLNNEVIAINRKISYEQQIFRST